MTEAKSKEKHGIWDPMPEWPIISPYDHSRVDSSRFTIGDPMPCRVDLNPMPESTLSLSQGLWIWPQVIFLHALLFFLFTCNVLLDIVIERYIPELKGHGNEADFLGFLHKSVRHRSLTLHFEPFRFWLRIRGDIRNRKMTPRLAKSGSRQECL